MDLTTASETAFVVVISYSYSVDLADDHSCDVAAYSSYFAAGIVNYSYLIVGFHQQTMVAAAD